MRRGSARKARQRHERERCLGARQKCKARSLEAQVCKACGGRRDPCLWRRKSAGREGHREGSGFMRHVPCSTEREKACMEGQVRGSQQKRGKAASKMSHQRARQGKKGVAKCLSPMCLSAGDGRRRRRRELHVRGGDREQVENVCLSPALPALLPERGNGSRWLGVVQCWVKCLCYMAGGR